VIVGFKARYEWDGQQLSTIAEIARRYHLGETCLNILRDLHARGSRTREKAVRATQREPHDRCPAAHEQ
jgi:hypothetical protein